MRLSLVDCWGLFHYGYSLYFDNLLNLAGINSLKALSLSTLFSTALELKKHAREADVILVSKENSYKSETLKIQNLVAGGEIAVRAGLL